MFGVVLGIVLAAGLVLILEKSGGSRATSIPDFGAIESAAEKKAAFFDYMMPFVNEENRKLMELRGEILKLEAKVEGGKSLSGRESKWLSRLYEEYGFDPQEPGKGDFFKNLLSRVDAIPPSLALAQAAIESGWGTSRFAREGYNFYGIWCYTPGCGLVPRKRPAGATYEVTKYKNVSHSVGAYFKAINTNQAYLTLRLIRADLRSNGKPINGMSLARGLEKYSERGMAYVGDVQGLIQSNGLNRFDA